MWDWSHNRKQNVCAQANGSFQLLASFFPFLGKLLQHCCLWSSLSFYREGSWCSLSSFSWSHGIHTVLQGCKHVLRILHTHNIQELFVLPLWFLLFHSISYLGINKGHFKSTVRPVTEESTAILVQVLSGHRKKYSNLCKQAAAVQTFWIMQHLQSQGIVSTWEGGWLQTDTHSTSTGSGFSWLTTTSGLGKLALTGETGWYHRPGSSAVMSELQDIRDLFLTSL